MISKCGSQCGRTGCSRYRGKHIKGHEAKLGMNFSSKHWKENCAAGAESRGCGATVDSKGSCLYHKALQIGTGRGPCPRPLPHSGKLGRSLTTLNRTPGTEQRGQPVQEFSLRLQNAGRDEEGSPSPCGKSKNQESRHQIINTKDKEDLQIKTTD